MADDTEIVGSEKVNDFVFRLLSTPGSMNDQLAYLIWGSVVTTTRAFSKVTININLETQRVFVAVSVRWWAKYDKFKKMRAFWLKRAEANAAKYMPNGWRLLVYFGTSADGIGGERPSSQSPSPNTLRESQGAGRRDQQPEADFEA